jgi:hypothetical protein
MGGTADSDFVLLVRIQAPRARQVRWEGVEGVLVAISRPEPVLRCKANPFQLGRIIDFDYFVHIDRQAFEGAVLWLEGLIARGNRRDGHIDFFSIIGKWQCHPRHSGS